MTEHLTALISKGKSDFSIQYHQINPQWKKQKHGQNTISFNSSMESFNLFMDCLYKLIMKVGWL